MKIGLGSKKQFSSLSSHFARVWFSLYSRFTMLVIRTQSHAPRRYRLPTPIQQQQIKEGLKSIRERREQQRHTSKGRGWLGVD
jgi:hypothetical protein